MTSECIMKCQLFENLIKMTPFHLQYVTFFETKKKHIFPIAKWKILVECSGHLLGCFYSQLYDSQERSRCEVSKML